MLLSNPAAHPVSNSRAGRFYARIYAHTSAYQRIPAHSVCRRHSRTSIAVFWMSMQNSRNFPTSRLLPQIGPGSALEGRNRRFVVPRTSHALSAQRPCGSICVDLRGSASVCVDLSETPTKRQRNANETPRCQRNANETPTNRQRTANEPPRRQRTANGADSARMRADARGCGRMWADVGRIRGGIRADSHFAIQLARTSPGIIPVRGRGRGSPRKKNPPSPTGRQGGRSTTIINGDYGIIPGESDCPLTAIPESQMRRRITSIT